MSATPTGTTVSQQSRPSMLYVSTELDTWETSTPEPDQDEICERCGYRRLDAEYYAWLRHRMTVAQQFQRSGRLTVGQYQIWRTRFNAIHAWAIARFGEACWLRRWRCSTRRLTRHRTSKTGSQRHSQNRHP